MASDGVYWPPAHEDSGSRQDRWGLLRKRLKNVMEPEGPRLFVFNTRRQFIRTVPVLPRDEIDMDDGDSRAEDRVGEDPVPAAGEGACGGGGAGVRNCLTATASQTAWPAKASAGRQPTRMLAARKRLGAAAGTVQECDEGGQAASVRVQHLPAVHSRGARPDPRRDRYGRCRCGPGGSRGRRDAVPPHNPAVRYESVPAPPDTPLFRRELS